MTALYAILFVISLFGIVGIGPAMRRASADAPTAGGRFRAVGKVAFEKLGPPVVWGGLALSGLRVAAPGDRRSASYVVFALVCVVLALVTLVVLASMFFVVGPWLWRLPQSIRATYARAPRRTA